MSRVTELAAAYDAARPRLIRIGYAVLGSHADAEDVVSDCWLKLAAADAKRPIDDVDAWATVAVARRALDVLRSARVRRETYVGPWLPEPVVDLAGPAAGASADPADRVTLDETVSFALLVVLERLSPAERTSWVLHDLFGMPFPEVADVVGRTPEAVRQLAARARAHVRDDAPRMEVEPAEHNAAVAAFTRAVAGGDVAELLRVLDPAVTLTSDGGGKVSAARRPVVGADRVARFLFGVIRKSLTGGRIDQIVVNGRTGLALFGGDRVHAVVSLTVRAGRISRVDMVLAPDKLPAIKGPEQV
jgi:RNA polymerase sigma-70 factor (ECF subfamily)